MIAGLGLAAGGDDRLAPLATAYVLLTAAIGPIAARIADRRSKPGASAGRLIADIAGPTPSAAPSVEGQAPPTVAP